MITKTCGIYEIRNRTNGKMYIGRSSNIESRLAGHKSALKHNRHKNSVLQQAYNSGDRFDYTILLSCEWRHTSFCERWYIAVFDATNRENGYNISEGGGSTGLGRKCSEEHNRKLSASISGSRHWNYGNHYSEERKRQMSESCRGEKSSWYGRRHTGESKLKISRAKAGKKCQPWSKDAKEKLSKTTLGESNNFYGKNHTDETRKRMSESQKRAWDLRRQKGVAA